MSQGKNQLYKILLDFYLEKININSDLFKEIIKYDYISLGKTSNVPAFLEKVDIEDFKNRCHLFLQNEENILKYIPRFENTPAKQIIKYVHFEVFKYDILKLKDDIKTKLEPKESIVLFVYDDKKVFEKSKSYTVEI